MADKFPRPFGRYVLLAPLAQGGMGALYLACVGDKGYERLCVIKTVLPHLADPEYVSRFRDEAKVVVRLSHGNLVPVFDAGLVDGELYLAMDHVDGKDLRAVWNRCAKKGIAFPIDVAVHIVRELARGLHHAHHFGGIKLVHRDVSPPNVLLAFSGEIKLTDFGLASSTLKLERTAPGIIYGKVSYMSPEQARGEPIDGRTDLYAAGIILWELLTGRQLFPQSEGADLIERVRHPAIDPPSSRAPRVPPMLDQIVLKALAPNQEDRYPTGEALRAALAGFLASNREYVVTDAAKVSTFLHDLFDDDVARERATRQELLEHYRERLEENELRSSSERGAAVERARQKAEVIAAMEMKLSGGEKTTDEQGKFREGEISGRILEQLAKNDTEKMIGQNIERWKILRKIGEGGMGRVFEAEHQDLGRHVAIKILHPVYSRTPEVVARFRMEARAASRIGHPNIVEVTDSGTTVDGAFYFVMEFLEGIDLADTLSRETRLPVKRALAISHQVAAALGAAHQINIVHRDLKPENIYLINREGNADFVKVLDFGIAKSLEEEKIKLTSPGMAMGTPEYMAPEQAGGKGCDARSDVYSLGAIMYEMLAGQAPIEGENLMEILMRKATEDPVDLGVRRPDLPREITTLVMRALARDPAERPQTMEDFAAEIQSCLVLEEGGLTTPQPLPAAADATAATVATVAASEDEQEDQRVRDWRLVGWVTLGGILMGLAAALVLIFTSDDGQPGPGGGVRRPGTGNNGTLGANNGPKNPPSVATPASQAPVPTPPSVAVQPTPPVLPATNPPTQEAPGVDPTRRKKGEPGGEPDPVKGLLPAPLDRVTANSKIEEGILKINSGNNEVGYRLCQDVTGTPQFRSRAFVCMGEAEFNRKRFDRAIDLGRKALKDKPGTQVYMLLGRAYYRKGNCREATQYLDKVITGANSSDPEAQRIIELCSQRAQ